MYMLLILVVNFSGQGFGTRCLYIVCPCSIAYPIRITTRITLQSLELGGSNDDSEIIA